MKKIITIMFLFIITFGIFVSATNCPPSVPKTYFGSVSYNSQILSGEFEIRAKMGDDVIGIGNVLNGNYNIDVSPCAGITGEVSFFINNIQTNQKGNYNGINDWGREVNLNLTINSMPSTSETCGDGSIQLGEECDRTNLAGRNINACGTEWTGTIFCGNNCLIDYSNCTAEFCGDGSCNNGETCSSCVTDCGACPSSGNPSSGGGGSSSTTSAGIIYIVPQTQITDGVSKEIKAGDSIKFEIGGTQHNLNLNSISGNSVSITVQSSPVTFVLEIGQVKKIDFENDNFYDLYVKLEDIANTKAKIKIQSIHEEVPQQSSTTNESTGINLITGKSPITGGVIGFVKSGKGIGLIIGLLIIVAGVIVIFKKRK